MRRTLIQSLATIGKFTEYTITSPSGGKVFIFKCEDTALKHTALADTLQILSKHYPTAKLKEASFVTGKSISVKLQTI